MKNIKTHDPKKNFSTFFLFFFIISFSFLMTNRLHAQACQFCTDGPCTDNISIAWGGSAFSFGLNTPVGQPVNYNCTWQDGVSLINGTSPGGWQKYYTYPDRYQGTVTCNVTGPTTCTASINIVPPAGYYVSYNPSSTPGLDCSFWTAETNSNPVIMYKVQSGNIVCNDQYSKYISFWADPVRNAASGQAQVTCDDGQSYNPPSPNQTFLTPEPSGVFYQSPWVPIPTTPGTVTCTISNVGVASSLGPNVATCSNFFIVENQTCGNGIIECGEVCDDGPQNGQPGKCNACTSLPTTCTGPLTFPAWKDPILQSGEETNPTKIRDVHFKQIQRKIDTLRTNAGLSPFDWAGCGFNPAADAPISIKLINCPRQALREVYAACGQAIPPGSGILGNVNPDTRIRKKHVEDLRTAIDNAI